MIGFLVPILPGVPLLAGGLLVLSTEYLWASHILAKMTSRFPSLARHLQEARKKARAWTGTSSPEPH